MVKSIDHLENYEIVISYVVELTTIFSVNLIDHLLTELTIFLNVINKVLHVKENINV